MSDTEIPEDSYWRYYDLEDCGAPLAIIYYKRQGEDKPVVSIFLSIALSPDGEVVEKIRELTQENFVNLMKRGFLMRLVPEPDRVERNR